MQQFKTALILILSGVVMAQPRLSGHLGLGYYNPQLTGFDTNELFPTAGAFSANILLDYGIYYQFYPNARVGLNLVQSLHFGTLQGDLSGTRFSRYLTYRMLTLESFYFPFRRFEFNFTLAPMWNKATIRIGAESSDEAWDSLLESYENSSVAVKRSNRMVVRFPGLASLLGVRFYLFTWLGIDLKSGFMQNFYNPDKWKFEGEKITGPELKIQKLPVYTLRFVFGW